MSAKTGQPTEPGLRIRGPPGSWVIPLTVAVAAENRGAGNRRTKAVADSIACDRYHSIEVHLLGEKRAIVGGRAMHGEDVFANVDRSRQSVQCAALFNGERGARKAVGFRETYHLAVQHPAVVIAAHRRKCQCCETFGSFAWPSASTTGRVVLSSPQLAALLDGCEWRAPAPRRRPEFAG
jgi:hypothetical protein